MSVLALVHLHGLFIDLHWRRSRTEEKFLSNVIFGRNWSHNVCCLLLGSVATVIQVSDRVSRGWAPDSATDYYLVVIATHRGVHRVLGTISLADELDHLLGHSMLHGSKD